MPPEAEAKRVAAKAKAESAAAGKAIAQAQGLGGAEFLKHEAPGGALLPPRAAACDYKKMDAIRLGHRLL